MSRLGALFHGLFFLVLLGPCVALEVRETRWGFDGKVVPGRMCLVSLLVANPRDTAFTGVLTLRETAGVGGSTGAPYGQPLSLDPHAERWVQFVVFITAGYETFVAEWGGGSDERFQLRQPAIGPPARVLLSNPANAFIRSAGMPMFPDALFPTSVAATDGLDGVMLDDAPRWDAARAGAFLDWVRRGGTLLVLPEAGGKFPQFTESLAALNIDGESAHVGAGTVLHISETRSEATAELFAKHGFPPPELKPGSSVLVLNLEQTLFQRLAQLTRPNIHWWLINSLTLLYIVVVGPANYRWARRLDYRLSIGGFVGCVALFSLAFSIVGRRGFDEAQAVYSLSIARAIEPGRFDVTQWISAFATHGDTYAFTHRAPENLYAAMTGEAINGQISDGQFVAGIPQFSSRQFVHRGMMAGADTSVSVETWESSADTLDALALKVGSGFPADAIEIHARYHDRFYRLERNGDLLTPAAADRAQTFAEFLPISVVQSATFQLAAAPSPDADLSAMLPLLYLRALDGRDYFSQSIAHGRQPADQLQLLIFAKSPEGFRLEGKGFDRENGCVLYVQDVFQPQR
jgi:hypothetical protein